MKKNKFVVVVTLIILGVACRLLPHAWNFAPIAAMALFAGTYLGKKEAIIVPVVSMLAGDLFLGFYDWRIMIPVYLSFVLAGLIGTIVRRHKSLETVLAGSISASVLFFFVTNFAVWLFSPLYAQSFVGLLECYAMAVPFFRNTFAGDLFYTGVLFGAYETALYFYRSKEKVFVKQLVD